MEVIFIFISSLKDISKESKLCLVYLNWFNHLLNKKRKRILYLMNIYYKKIIRYHYFQFNIKRNKSQEQLRILLPFRNLAFVEELGSILNLVYHLAKDSQFWKLRNPTQFLKLNSLIRIKTPLFFGCSTRSESMINQIRPISSYETFLHDSTIRETSSQPMFLPGIKSTRKLTVSGLSLIHI